MFWILICGTRRTFEPSLSKYNEKLSKAKNIQESTKNAKKVIRNLTAPNNDKRKLLKAFLNDLTSMYLEWCYRLIHPDSNGDIYITVY